MRRLACLVLATLSALSAMGTAGLWVRSCRYRTGIVDRPHQVHAEGGVFTYGYRASLGGAFRFYDERAGDPEYGLGLSPQEFLEIWKGFNDLRAEADKSAVAVWNLAGFELTGFPADSFHRWYAAVPLWFPTLISALLCLLFVRLFRRSPFPPGCCRQCGYDLRASPAKCLECGTKTTASATA